MQAFDKWRQCKQENSINKCTEIIRTVSDKRSFCYFVICRGVVDDGARMEELVQNTDSLACRHKFKHWPICNGDPLVFFH